MSRQTLTGDQLRQDVSLTPPVDPPTDRRSGRSGRSGPWWSSGALLLLGGAANFVGAWLRWFGPQRQEGLAIRQDGSSTPLTTGEHVVPFTSEFTAAGHLLVAAALVVLIFLAWGRLRWIAAPALLLGAYFFAGQAVLWLREVLTGINSYPVAGADPPMVDAWSWWAWFPATSLWPLGLAPVVVLTCAARQAATVSSGRSEGACGPAPGGAPDPQGQWSPVVLACALLTVSATVMEFLLLVIFDMSHDDPQGLGMYSGAAQALAGAFLLAGAVRGRRSRVRGGTCGEGDRSVEPVAADGRTPSWSRASSRAWSRGHGALQLGGALVALSALLGIAPLLPALGSAAEIVPGQDAPMTAGTVAAIAGHGLYAVGVLVLVAGPWGGPRRALAALSAAVCVAPTVASIALLVSAPELGEQLAWLGQDSSSSAWRVVGAVGFAVTLTMERLAGAGSGAPVSVSASAPPLPQLPLLLATILLVGGQPLVTQALVNEIGPGGSPVPAVVGAVVGVLWGLAWWVTGRAGRAPSTA